jgi:glycosyltransferase involved in cell wall biosynthesis/peptidoglycan/xylan/chitin deacetylase (PgdA/CDA1 family)
MRTIRNLILNARTTLSQPFRNRQLQRHAERGQAPMSVLFYHRVADIHPNPWTISTAEFERQIEFCRERFSLVSLADVQLRCRLGENTQPSVTFTFDDGYAENCRTAIPLLIRHQIPCTYFVTLDHIKTGRPFQHDVDRGQLLPINSVDELRAMADGGIEIGLHARTHFDFSRPVTRKQLQSEIIDAAGELADLIRRPIRYFAFPYGLPKHLSPMAIDAIREAGLQGYCSAYGAYNFPDQDPFHIRRIHGDPEFALFRNWLTFDSRKVKAERKQKSQFMMDMNPSSTRDTARKPLRTLFVITSMPVGGAETLLANMMDRFDPARIQPEVVCLKEPGPLGEKIAARHKVHSGLLTNKWDIGVLPRLTALMKDRQADAVITVGAGDKMFWGRLAAWRAGVPVVCSALHSTGWPDGIGRLNRTLTSITDGFIAVAQHHGVHLAKHERFPADRVHIIRNGIDCQRFAPSVEARSTLRRELGIDRSSKLVGIVAALRPEKNHRMFVNVAEKLSRQSDDVHFVIVGDGPERTAIEAQIAAHNLESRVHLLGTRHDTDQIVAGLDLFLLCSHNEASPVSILEALSSEVPVISTRVGSVAESVIDGETGYLVDCDDEEAMAKKARMILDDSQLGHDLGENGRKLVIETGSLDSMVEGYTTLIEWLYERKRGARRGVDRTAKVESSAASSESLEEVH